MLNLVSTISLTTDELRGNKLTPDSRRAEIHSEGNASEHLLGVEAVDCLAHNMSLVHPRFDAESFRRVALDSLAPDDNGGQDPFEVSMRAQHELTKRFCAEFSIRPFLIKHQGRTLSRLLEWTSDPDPHIRRLCSEGTRPRLPWPTRIPAFIANPAPVFPILEALKDDGDLYVRRSVANHLGDIAKDHPEIVFSICERWLSGATNEVKWLIRHALRHPAKKGVTAALQLRAAAK